MRDGSGHGVKSPVVMIGLDSCDATTALRLAASGELPNLARLLDSAGRATIRNPFGLFVSALWPAFATAAGPERHGYHCWETIDVASYGHRLVTPNITLPPFWDALGAAGRRVAIVDVPHTRFPRPVNGIAVAEWGCHDRHFGFHSQPPGLAREIAAREGLHPALGIEAYAVRDFSPDDRVHRAGLHRSLAENRLLLDGLIEGVARKRRLLSRLWAKERWDLFVAVFAESHAVGHQFWHLHDTSHPRHDPAMRAALGVDPVLAVYRALDAALGAFAAEIGPRATFLVSFSHGMAAHHDGTHLLEEVLRRLDLRYRGRPLGPVEFGRRELQRAAVAAAGLKLPGRMAEVVARAVRPFEQSTAQKRSRQLFFAAPNNSVYGGVRFNLAGREPYGRADARELDGLMARLADDLLDLVNEDTGLPVIRVVHRRNPADRRTARDSQPDLFLDWERSAPVERIRSAAIGRIASPYLGWRTGDHRPEGLLLARDSAIAPGAAMEPIRVEDIPASIAARLGVALPGTDGVAVPWLAGNAPEAAEAAA